MTPSRRGEGALQPLGNPKYPWDIVGVEYLTYLTKSGSHGPSVPFIIVCHFNILACFVPCPSKANTAEESSDIFISNCYRLHGGPKCIVLKKCSKFVVIFFAMLYGNSEP